MPHHESEHYSAHDISHLEPQHQEFSHFDDTHYDSHHESPHHFDSDIYGVHHAAPHYEIEEIIVEQPHHTKIHVDPLIGILPAFVDHHDIEEYHLDFDERHTTIHEDWHTRPHGSEVYHHAEDWITGPHVGYRPYYKDFKHAMEGQHHDAYQMAERESAEFHFFHEDLEPTLPYHKGITESQSYHDFHDHHEPIHHDDYHIWEESHYMPSFSVPIHV